MCRKEVIVVVLAAAAVAATIGLVSAEPDAQCGTAAEHYSWVTLEYEAAIKRGDTSTARFWHSEFAPAKEYRNKVCGT